MATDRKAGNRELSFPENSGGYGIRISVNGVPVASAEHPIGISLKTEEGQISPSSDLLSAYGEVKEDGDNVRGTARVTTASGSIFYVEDNYTRHEGYIILDRNVKVEKASAGDIGYSSRFSLGIDAGEGKAYAYDFFIPSILYKDCTYMRQNTIASDMKGDRLYVKETRCGLPLAMVRAKSGDEMISLMHYRPQIDVDDNVGGGNPGEVNDNLQYGSIGYTLRPSISIDFNYPCLEGPRNYETGPVSPDQSGEIWTGRFHKVAQGSSQSYSLAILTGEYGSYTESMEDCFLRAYSLQDPPVKKMDVSNIYRDNIDLFKSEYREFGTGNVKAAGLPWSLDLPDGKNTEGVSFQMGFVGQQIAVGYHLYRYGLDHSDQDAIKKGKAIVDFWTSDSIMGSFFPIVWWDPADDDTAGRTRGYPCFLRCMVDGMEGLLDACRISEAYSDYQPSWDAALSHVASNLVSRQNSDGSFFRAYNESGEIASEWDRNTQASSKVNTPVAVRFLAKMYEHTGEDKYKTAAIKAADYSYNEIYSSIGKYIGGTPDNPNVIDKEAAIYALYAFNAAHELTGEEKYLTAAQHAAVSVMSWAYCYDFAVPNGNAEDAAINPFSKGGVLGYSFISTGHSGADNYISYVFYEMFKLYVKTGREEFLKMARFLEYDTKLCSDYDGRMGYKYRAFLPEATTLANFQFKSVSLWLPWCSCANIEPMVNLQEAFGSMDIDSIDYSAETLSKLLQEYGIGGKPLKR